MNPNAWPQGNMAAAPQANFTDAYPTHPTMNNFMDTAATNHVTHMPAAPGSTPPPPVLSPSLHPHTLVVHFISEMFYMFLHLTKT